MKSNNSKNFFSKLLFALVLFVQSHYYIAIASVVAVPVVGYFGFRMFVDTLSNIGFLFGFQSDQCLMRRSSKLVKLAGEAKGKIKVATCQFAVGSSIKRNANRIKEFMRSAGKSRADSGNLHKVTR